jgi:hypothetical protein
MHLQIAVPLLVQLAMRQHRLPGECNAQRSAIVANRIAAGVDQGLRLRVGLAQQEDLVDRRARRAARSERQRCNRHHQP